MICEKELPIVITMGDPAGIGPEIIVKAYAKNASLSRATFVIGDSLKIQQVCQLLKLSLVVQIITENDLKDLSQLPAGVIAVMPNPSSAELIKTGEIQALAGKIAAECIELATDLHLRKKVAAIVTAPLHKEALKMAGYPFPGHTEMLQSLCANFMHQKVADLPVRMMLMNEELRTVLLSIHVSLKQAIEAVTFDNIVKTLEISHDSMSKILKRSPHIAVAGLNPHAGEGGLLGLEEIEIIQPAIQKAQSLGIHVTGPYPPDTIYMRARQLANSQNPIDIVLAMYHDQGLIPVKYLGVDSGVNVTLGLPITRTSPDHGTAFDIAGTGKADPSSLLEAIKVAQNLANLGNSVGN
jgi:4-hydroxythreonine-4-phosphate dehydrogenase